ncbi:TRAP transporter large permease subunit [Spirochaetia bacterium 38H-sp]|uniref:TRAP transporter large permease subunit n=1 Tax=Rarispira pelagica TaxID=3141764 RepID=A0ABU9U9Z4_9SPIR
MSRNKIFRSIDGLIASVFLLILASLPIIEMLLRSIFSTGIPGSYDYIKHLVLLVAFFGAMYAAKKRQHLSIALLENLLTGNAREYLLNTIYFLSSFFSLVFTIISVSHFFIAFEEVTRVGFIPTRFITWVMPVGFFVISIYFLQGIKAKRTIKLFLFILSFVLAVFISLSSVNNLLFSFSQDPPVFMLDTADFIANIARSAGWLIILLIIFFAFAGLPLFIAIGTIAMFLLMGNYGTAEVVTDEIYSLLTDIPIPPIALFTLTGFVLSESKAGDRFIKFFKSIIGNLPGSMAIIAILVSAFFTTFTGASGVAILALGGVLSYVMIKSGEYSKKFTYGLLTASGTIGLLFPPSLPIIIYGSVAQISIKDLFIGGLIPGFLMVGSLVVYTLIRAIREKKKTPDLPKLSAKDKLLAFYDVVWESLLPVFIIAGFFSGLFNLTETAAFSALYVMFIEVFIKKEIPFKRLPAVILKSIPIIGGILLLLGSAKALSFYIVDSEFPLILTAWMKAHISSPFIFLLLVTVVLLITGCLMDIFSAIMIVAPLIVPMAELYSINPVHMGILFLANLAVGYLTPPVGLNLFIASYRFNADLLDIYKNVIPFFIVLIITVLLITYIPALSTWLPSIIGG